MGLRWGMDVHLGLLTGTVGRSGVLASVRGGGGASRLWLCLGVPLGELLENRTSYRRELVLMNRIVASEAAARVLRGAQTTSTSATTTTTVALGTSPTSTPIPICLHHTLDSFFNLLELSFMLPPYGHPLAVPPRERRIPTSPPFPSSSNLPSLPSSSPPLPTSPPSLPFPSSPLFR